ncbi:MAG: hypothetical protein C4329_11435 [Chitinophagaceae bacterium]
MTAGGGVASICSMLLVLIALSVRDYLDIKNKYGITEQILDLGHKNYLRRKIISLQIVHLKHKTDEKEHGHF